ncbi:hypothetical protein JCM11641_002835 [Rhodosporidiobolus odoratus]
MFCGRSDLTLGLQVWPLHKKACGAPGAPCYLPPLKEEEYQQMQDLASAPFFVKAWPLTKASGLAIGGEGQSEQYIRFGLWKGKWHNLLTYLMQESCGIKEPKRSYLLALLRAFAIGNSFETLKPHIVCTPEHVWSPIYTLSTLVAGYFEHMHSMTTCFPGSSLHNKFRVAKFNIFHAAAPFLHQVELFHYLAILAHSKKRPAALTGQVLHHAWTRLENILDQEELRFASLFRRSASASDVSDDEDELSKMGEEYMRGMVRKDFAIVRNEALKELGAVHLITEPRSSDRDEENERAGDHDACRTQ